MQQRKSNSVAIGVIAFVALGVLLVAATGHGSRPSFAPPASAPALGWRGLVGSPRPQVAIGQRELVVLNAPSLADKVAAAGGIASDSEERRWTASAFAAQQQLLFELAARGLQAHPDYRYTRVLNGFSAALDARAVALLERAPQVRGVYPVRAAFPASTSSSVLRDDETRLGLRISPGISLGRFNGRGVTIALLDTGVDGAAPYLHGHVLDGLDILGHGRDTHPRSQPGDRSQLERHGTEMAGILVGAGGPAGLAGVADQAKVLPIRVAGWQPDAHGAFAVYARTDQILAGLEKAVDPNGDGDAHDAARVVLLPLVEPFAAFSDGPLARAVRGATELDTLVVAAAGNDGPTGPVFGSIGGPGGAETALTVGAADERDRVAEVPVVVRAGLDVLFRRTVPLASAALPARPATLNVVPVSLRRGSPVGLFDERGASTVAGSAVLVDAGDSPREVVRSITDAGANLVVLAAGDLPNGGLGLEQGLTAPVIGVPSGVALRMKSALARGLQLSVAIGAARASRNSLAGKVAAFSSSGLSFDGRVKPDVVGPGVAVATSEPGSPSGGTSEFSTLSGSSVAAAAVAGAAALLLQARPDLTASEAHSLLVDTARRIRNEQLASQGAGLVDPAVAATAELATDPATISFGRVSGAGWQAARALVVRNVSSRAVTVYVAPPRRRNERVQLEARPRQFELASGRTRRVQILARAVGAPRGEIAGGQLTLAPLGGVQVHVPWAVVVGGGDQDLLGTPHLSVSSFVPSELSPALLSLRAGRVEHLPGGNSSLQPVLRLDLQLRDASGKPLGLLARLRDLLPGRYAFGLTGRNPDGGLLSPGSYGLRLVAWPTDGGPPTIRAVEFRIE